MTNVSSTTTEPPADDSNSEQELPCPACGYDLRGTQTDRCSECGKIIDRTALRDSAFPWAHRKRLGRLRAFLSTVWLVSVDSLRIRHELSRPQEPGNVRRFRFWLTAWVCLWELIALTIVVRDNDPAGLVIQPKRFGDGGLFTPYFRDYEGWQQDLAVPWCAGMTLVWLIPVYALLLAIYLTGIARDATHVPAPRRATRDAAKAVGTYASAPLFFLFVPVLMYGGVHALNVYKWTQHATEDRAVGNTLVVLRIAAVALTFALLVLAFRRAGQWITRARHAGVIRFLFGVGECLFRGAVGLVVCAAIVPWCAGLIRLAIASVFFQDGGGTSHSPN